MDVSWQKQPPADDVTVPGYPTEGDAPDPVTVKMAFFSPKDMGSGTNPFRALLENTEVPMGEQIGLLAGGLSFTPEKTDILVRAGETLPIIDIDLIAPANIPVLWLVRLAL